jgi:NHL repeat
MNVRLRVAAATLAATLAACSGASQTGAGGLPSAPSERSTYTPAKAHSAHYVYVSSQFDSQGAVFVYSTKGRAQLPVATITNGISTPAGLAVDAGGSLYVANSGNSTVTVYAPGEVTPTKTYSDGISTPTGVAVGSDGTLYVSNETGSGSYTGTVTEYPSGSTSPSTTIELPGEYAFTLALDKSNALYVSWFSLSSYGIAIYKYPTEGSSGGSNLNLDLPPGAFPAYGLAFDDRGNLMVPYEPLDHNPPKYIAVFPPGATQPAKKIKMGGLVDIVTGMAFPHWKSKLLYVTAENDHDWLALTYPKLVPRDVVNVGGPTGLALSP